ncbi:MAG: hypothetical protein Q4E05_01060 [Pseudoclavibacter sp.]|nr:hypothetical protein [Pseudoclavibacter sp.]
MSRPGTMRALSAALLAIGLCTGVAGCTALAESAAAGDGACTPALPSEPIAGLGVEGRPGDAPRIRWTEPQRPSAPAVQRLGTGSGLPVTPNGVFEGAFTLVDGGSGRELLPYGPLAVDERGAAAPITAVTLELRLPGLARALRCAAAGERVLALLPGPELLPVGPGGLLDGDAPETVLAVVDLLRVYPSGASGTALPPHEGFPAVVTAPDGHPGVTVPEREPPLRMRSAETIRGYGSLVRSGQRLTLHVSVHAWSDGDLLGSTRTAGGGVLRAPATADGWNDGLFGATPELAGRRVGSQLVVIVPAEQAAAAPGPVRGGRLDGQALVLVVDVLAADPLSP